MDALTAVTGVIGLLILAALLGWDQIKDALAGASARRTALAQAARDDERARRAELNPPAVCQCGHALAFHTPAAEGTDAAGACREHAADHPDQACRCAQYVGPTPFPGFTV